MGKIAALQMTSTHIVEENLDLVARYVSQAANLGAEVLVLPENFALMGKTEKQKFEHAESPEKGPIQQKIKELAKTHGIWIVAGTMPMLSDSEHKVFNTTWVYDNHGKTVARYDKIHLFDVKVKPGVEEYTESSTVFPGKNLVCVDSPVGKLGLSICYDLRFPELYRRLVKEGAEILLVPSAFTVPTGIAHWEVLLRARAIENVCYVVAPAQVGEHTSGRLTYGHTMIIDPYGKILAEEKENGGLIMVDLDLDYQKEIRERLPVLHHRKID